MSAPDFPAYPTNSPSAPEELTEDNTSLVDTAKTDLADLGDEVSQQAAALGEEAKAQVGHIAEKAKGLAAEQKDLLATQLGGFTGALDKLAVELEDSNDASALYVRMVADGAQRLTATIKDNDVDDILGIAQDFGRKQPVAFLGAAALLGFAASRFVLASAKRQSNPDGAERPAPAFSNNRSPEYSQSVGGDDAGI
jgi:hypothetical protein